MKLNIYTQTYIPKDQKKLHSLKTEEKKKKDTALKTRLKLNPYISDLEYLIGAFIEMYEPHLYDVVHKLSKRGYSIETTSGLSDSGKSFPSLVGHFPVDYITKNKLEKNGIKIRENEGVKSLIFWPEEVDIEYIKEKWFRVIDILPDKGILTRPSNSPGAMKFRRKYGSKNPILQRERLFERLEFNVLTQMQEQVKNRKLKNPHPDKIEAKLGLFIEELEPPVKDAVLQMHKKGYSTDRSGFANKIDYQTIEGDFELTAIDIEQLQKLGVSLERNPSGYTKLQFAPKFADTKKIIEQWKKIIAVLPHKKKPADPTMTKRARDFRIKYC